MSDNSAPPQRSDNPPAIMGAAGNENQEPEIVVFPNQPREAHDMRGLLRFAMEATAMEDAPGGPTQFEAMSEERRKFLENVLKSMSVDVVQVLMKALTKLESVDKLKPGDDPQEYEEALEILSDTVDNMDFANDFHKIGGFGVLLPCLSSLPSLQWRTAELIAELSQNNPYCQTMLIEEGIMPILLNRVDSGADDLIKVKALYAVSCLTRNCPQGLEQFILLDGFSFLLRAMQSGEEKLKTKSAFLLGALCNSKPEVKDDLQKMGFVHQLVGLISEEWTPAHEHILYGLLNLIRDHDECIEDCRDPNLQLQALLSLHIDSIQGREECQEEVEYAKQILSIVFSEDTSCER